MKKTIYTLLILIILTVPIVSAREIQPTTFWSWQGNSKLDGSSVPVGTLIEAYDPDGVLCGSFTVVTAG